MNDPREEASIDALTQRFFAAFDNRRGQVPQQDRLVELFAERAIIIKHQGGSCEFYSPAEFAQPRIVLLASGELIDFHEWEQSSATEIIDGLAARTSRYAKAGLYRNEDYSGGGTKFFQFAKFAPGWRIVALSWTDDPV